MKLLWGIALCFLIAVPAWFIGRTFPLVGSPVAAILMGIILSLIFPALAKKSGGRLAPAEGIRFTSKKLLQYSIVLLGFEMDLVNVAAVGGRSLGVMLFTLAAAFLTAFLLGRVLGLPGNTTVLIGVGTAVCGGSAIAAAAPVIRAEDEDVTRAISTIFLFNIAAVFIFPALGRMFSMDDVQFGIFAGTAINDTSSVVAAGTVWSSAAGNDTALATATIVKLTRTLMIVPITLFLAVVTTRKMKTAGERSFRFAKVFPWFVIVFLLAAVAGTFLPIPRQATAFLVKAGKFLIVMAMGAIGLNTNLKSLFANGIKPIILGLACWFAVAGVSLLVQGFF